MCTIEEKLASTNSSLKGIKGLFGKQTLNMRNISTPIEVGQKSLQSAVDNLDKIMSAIEFKLRQRTDKPSSKTYNCSKTKKVRATPITTNVGKRKVVSFVGWKMDGGEYSSKTASHSFKLTQTK